MIFSNADEELDKLKQVLEMTKEINAIEAKKLFLSKKDIAELLECSERAAGELMNLPEFPLVKIGKTPMVNIFAFNEFTQNRIVLNEQ